MSGVTQTRRPRTRLPLRIRWTKTLLMTQPRPSSKLTSVQVLSIESLNLIGGKGISLLVKSHYDRTRKDCADMAETIGRLVRNFALLPNSPLTDVYAIVFPLIFHSIPDEIPQDSQPLITRLYQLWLVLLGTLVVNMVACILILISGSSDGGKDLGSSIGYVASPFVMGKMILATRRYIFVIAPLSFLLWYRCADFPSLPSAPSDRRLDPFTTVT